MLWRGFEYLNWRYVKHPINDYQIFVYDSEKVRQGFCITRRVKLMGREMLVVMELWSLNKKVDMALLRHAEKWARNEKINFMVMIDSKFSLLSGLLSGFLPIPSMFLPKRQILTTYMNKDVGDSVRLGGGPWRVQMGDWDAF